MALSSFTTSHVFFQQGAFLVSILFVANAAFSYSRLGRAGCASQSTAQLGLMLNSSSPNANMSCAAADDCKETDCEAKCSELSNCTGFTFAQDRLWDPQTFEVILKNGLCLLHSIEVSDYALTACGLPIGNERKCFIRNDLDAASSAAQRRRRFYSHYCPDAPAAFEKVSYDRCPQGYMLNFAEDAGTPCQADAPPFDFVKRCELPDCERRCNELDWCIGFTVSISVSKFGGYTCLFHSTNLLDFVRPDYPCGTEGSNDCQCWMKPDNLSTTITNDNSSLASTSNSSMIMSGDTVYLKTFVGAGEHVDVNGTLVQARWEERGDWQAFVIERLGGGHIESGDVVFLRTYWGTLIDVEDVAVRARWEDRGIWQSLIVSKTGGGFITNEDTLCLKAHTGQYLEVTDQLVQATSRECTQAFGIEKDDVDAFHSGDSVMFKTRTGNYLEVESSVVRARWNDQGIWQTFIIENKAGRILYSGDEVFLHVHTGTLMDVQHDVVEARWNDHGDWQRFTIQKKDGLSALYPGDIVFLKAHTGNFIDVVDDQVRARWQNRDSWEALVIERAPSQR